jgi:hypothetical protein
VAGCLNVLVIVDRARIRPLSGDVCTGRPVLFQRD